MKLPAQVEPVSSRRLPPRDGQITRQARFGRQQVVTGVIELPMGEVEADGEQIAIGAVKRPEVHRGGENLSPVRQAAKPVQPLRRLRRLNGRDQRADRVDGRSRTVERRRARTDQVFDPAGRRGEARRCQ